VGEALALRWQDVYLSPEDTEPYLAVRLSFSGGTDLGLPKTGRSREVQMSKRLRAVLLEWRAECGDLGEGTILRLNEANYRNRAWAWIRKRAKLPTKKGRQHIPKDLRDTYASHLVTANFPMLYSRGPTRAHEAEHDRDLLRPVDEARRLPPTAAAKRGRSARRLDFQARKRGKIGEKWSHKRSHPQSSSQIRVD